MVEVSPPEPFYHLSIQNNHNFIVEGLTAHNMFINVKLPSGSREKIQASPTDSVESIK